MTVRIPVFATILVFGLFHVDPVRGQPADRPNVLIVYADQHRFDCLGAMGNPDVETPHMDGLARDGTLFRNSFCVWPVCTPSRYSLLSGQYVRQHRGRNNRSTLLSGTVTFANILRTAGYRTKAVGKMHFTPAYLEVGYDEMELAEQDGPGRLVDDYHRYLKARGLIDSDDLIDQVGKFRQQASEEYWQTFGARASNLAEEHHSTTWIGNRAVETLSRWKKSQPNLLMVSFIKPHHPFDPPAPWNEMYDPDELTILPGWLDEPLQRDQDFSQGYFLNHKLTLPALRGVMAHYYATISQIDAHVGRMIETLKQQGLYDDTLIIYTADHGEFMGFNHMILKANHMYDPLMKVPLIVKFPHSRHAGKVSEALVNSLDVTSTIIQQARCKPGPDMRGKPLGPILSGNRPEPQLVFAEAGPYTMVRSKTRKLLYTTMPDKSLYFDLERDPLETRDLYKDPQYQSEIRDFKGVLLDWLQRETQTRHYVNLDAKRINQPNVPPDRIDAERQMQKYIDEQMAKELSSK